MAQQMLGVIPAASLLADAVANRHADIVKECFVKIGDPIDRWNCPNREARRFHVEQQESDSLLLLAGVAGAHQREHPIGMLRLGGPDFLTIDDILIAIARGAGFEGGEVRTRAWLGKALAD